MNPVGFLKDVLSGLLSFISSTPFTVLLVAGIVIAVLGLIFKITRKVAKYVLIAVIVLFIINRIA